MLIACPLQQWLRERASLSSYIYIACLVNFSIRCVASDELDAPAALPPEKGLALPS